MILQLAMGSKFFMICVTSFSKQRIGSILWPRSDSPSPTEVVLHYFKISRELGAERTWRTHQTREAQDGYFDQLDNLKNEQAIDHCAEPMLRERNNVGVTNEAIAGCHVILFGCVM